VVLLLVIGAAGWRLMALMDDVRAIRATAARLEAKASDLQPADLDRVALDGLRSDVTELEDRIGPIRSLLDGPVGDVAGGLPVVGPQVAAAVSLMDATDSLTDVSHIGLDMVEQVVALREANDRDPSTSLMRGLTSIVATSADDVDRMSGLIEGARSDLAGIPDDAMGQLREARDLIARPLDRYAPLLDRYREVDDLVLSLLGWGGEKRYLVLAQNPAELRPAGGYAGTVGIITLRDGELVEQRFQNVYDLDLKRDLRYVQAPDDLIDYVLGEPSEEGEEQQSWRLADAAWSPDFPSSARTAAELYAIEADGARVDGVIAITTFALDRLLEVIGPVDVPDFGVVVEPGDVTMTLIEATRPGAGPTSPESLRGRKDVLDSLASTVMQRLLSLPPEQWMSMAGALEDIGAQRMAMAWLVDEAAQQQIEELGWGGAVRQDPGDYVYVVESNVAPTSKYNLAVQRSDSLVVKLDENGDALDSLQLHWQNDADKEGEPYETLRLASQNGPEGWYGAYLRVLVPEGSELVTASGEAESPISGVERIETESGRTLFGNALVMEPGESSLTYLWEVPSAATRADDGWEYRLVVQRQPGASTVPLDIRVDLPSGATVSSTSEGAVVDGDRVRLETDLTQDVELQVSYQLPGAEPAAGDVPVAGAAPSPSPAPE
jgi:hypothetical protein